MSKPPRPTLSGVALTGVIDERLPALVCRAEHSLSGFLAMAVDWRGIRYFRRQEFGYHGDVEPDPTLVDLLDEARKYAGIPFVITSGIRAPRHDGDTSSHTTGHAADIRCATSRHRMQMLDALRMVGFDRIGVYNRHIHVDTDTTKPSGVIWVGVSR